MAVQRVGDTVAFVAFAHQPSKALGRVPAGSARALAVQIDDDEADDHASIAHRHALHRDGGGLIPVWGVLLFPVLSCGANLPQYESYHYECPDAMSHDALLSLTAADYGSLPP